MNTIAISLPLQIPIIELRQQIEALCAMHGGSLESAGAIPTKDGGRIGHLTYIKRNDRRYRNAQQD